jgi:drug/metabolite transporter (DMT)-like permease
MSGHSTRPPPGAGSQPFEPSPPRPPPPRLRWLPFIFGAGAVFWLVQLAQFAAVVAAPAGRDQLHQALVQAGVKGDLSSLVVAEASLVFFYVGAAICLHAVAYFGLRARRPSGWIAALIVAAGWSLILIGIPVLYLLAKSSTRHAYGIP